MKKYQSEFPISFATWPPDASALSSLGFDSVQTNAQAIHMRKNFSTDLAGRPHNFLEIKITKSHCLLHYSCPDGQDEQIAQNRALLTALRALSLLPASQTTLTSFCALILPTLEHSEKLASLPYDLLYKRFNDLQERFEELEGKSLALAKAAESASIRAIELEKKQLELQGRLQTLSSVPDESLRELLLDYLASHRGSFDSSKFCAIHAIPPARAQEGLDMLLKSGSIKKVGGGFSAHPAPMREFSISPQKHFPFLGKRRP